jgi:hypothetical protein
MPTVQLDDNPTPSECPDCKGRGTIALLTSVTPCRRCGGAGTFHGRIMKVRRGVIGPDGQIIWAGYCYLCNDGRWRRCDTDDVVDVVKCVDV